MEDREDIGKVREIECNCGMAFVGSLNGEGSIESWHEFCHAILISCFKFATAMECRQDHPVAGLEGEVEASGFVGVEGLRDFCCDKVVLGFGDI